MSSAAALHPAIAELLDSRRLGSLEASRHRFTVSREEALLRLREQVRDRDDERWDWTLFLVRAANALSEIAEARVEVGAAPTVEGGASEPLRVTTIDVITPGTALDGLGGGVGGGLADVLAGALEPDLGEPVDGAEPEQRVARFRMLIGRALNSALAHEPVAVELTTAAGGRRFERREQLVAGRDPYVEAKIAACVGDSRFVVRVIDRPPGLSSRLGRWLRGRGEVNEELAALWRSQRLADHEADNVGEDGVISLGPALTRTPIRFGRHALYDRLTQVEGAPAPLRSSLFLVRDGLLIVDLGPALREQSIDPADLAGWVDCPKLRLTADERSVARDVNFETLVAWLLDAQARRDEQGVVTWPESLWSESGWGPRSASGHVLTAKQLADDARRGREVIYVWRHQAGAVPAHAKAKIAALWPSEELALRERFVDLRLIPLRALGGQTDIDPHDLTSLAQGCYEPLSLVKDSPLEPDAHDHDARGFDAGLRVSVDAYVHRAPTAKAGRIVIRAYEREVARFDERAKTIPGVTLVCRVRDDEAALDVVALRREVLLLGRIAELCRRRTLDYFEALLAHVMSRANPWENPFLRAALDELGPGSIELRYQQTEDGLRLAWRDTVLLDVVVGQTRARESKTLRDALRLLRARGYLLVGHPLKRYEQVLSADPMLAPWLLDDAARGLLQRVLGRAPMLDMPIVAEAHPLVVDDPIEDQRHLVRGRATITNWLEQAATDPLSRLRLLGHLLVARGLERDALGLESVPLLSRYDPRALSPTRLVSLASVLSERPPPGLIPAGAVHRGLPRPMLEVVPGLAALLAEVEELVPGTGPSAAAVSAGVTIEGPGERSTTAPIRRRTRGVPPLLATAVVNPLLIGRLQVAGDGESDGIGLWSGGLRVGELRLPEPLGRVSGRLLLTPVGKKVPKSKVRELVTAEARALLADALRQRTLLPPDGPQRRRLEHFVEFMRTAVRAKDSFGLADELGLGEPEDRGARAAMLRKMSLAAAPLRALPKRRDALLVGVVRQSLAMPVHFDTAMLSWKVAKLGKRRRDGSFEIEFGLRNAWIQRGLDEDRKLDAEAHERAALLAGVLVVASFFEQSWIRDEVDLGAEHMVVAMWRLLKLAAG